MLNVLRIGAGRDGLTIAACYLSPEGIVLGADSTSTYGLPTGNHYYNFGQKIFEVGENSTIGMVTWGLGGLALNSYRTLIALFADDLRANPVASEAELADRWTDQFWIAYSSGPVASTIQRCKDLDVQPTRSQAEEDEYLQLKQSLVVGFCIGGYLLPSRTPFAFSILFDPLTGRPTPYALPLGSQWFWGVPNLVKRMIFGCADELRLSILQSGLWTGSAADLDSLIQQHTLSHPVVPVRDAIDFTYASILSTIKAMKFSNMAQVCGGPIEIAAITTDRPFRWVRHKSMDAAITEGEYNG